MRQTAQIAGTQRNQHEADFLCKKRDESRTQQSDQSLRIASKATAQWPATRLNSGQTCDQQSPQPRSPTFRQQRLRSSRPLPPVCPQSLNKRLNLRLSPNRNPTPIAVRRKHPPHQDIARLHEAIETLQGRTSVEEHKVGLRLGKAKPEPRELVSDARAAGEH